MAISITLVDQFGNISTTSVDPSSSVSVLTSHAETAFGIPLSAQRLQYNGAALATSQTIAQAGIADGDLVMVQAAAPPQLASVTPPQQQPAQQAGGRDSENAMLNSVLGDPGMMNSIRQRFPQLHERLQRRDPAASRHLLDYFRNIAQSLPLFAPLMGASNGRNLSPGDAAQLGQNRPQQQQQQMDPLSADGQRRIEEAIRQENVMKNMEAALEHNPESFGRVVMLFVDCKINGIEGIKALVDSGAQATIISKACAERCNILRLMDASFEGVARGVGTAKIYGRIHLALVTLGDTVFEITFTVMDGVGSSYDVLLGLDMLRKHAAVIDLRADCLRIGGTSVPFLAEKDIPRAMREEGGVGSAAPSSSGRPKSTNPGIRPPPAATAGVAPPASSSAAFNPADVDRLVALGFPRSSVIEALTACGGDPDQAASMLFGDNFGS